MINMESRHLQIVKNILKKYPYDFYVYGSRVKGLLHKNSDLDICFMDQIPFNIQSHIEEEFEESDLPFQVDFSDFNLMSKEFQDLIKKDLVKL
jgi:predicted nucleotidyltransferase